MLTFTEEYFERGRQQGKAEVLLRVLAVRGIPVDDSARRHILSCTDIATLEQWFDRALNATQLSEVLGEPAQ